MGTKHGSTFRLETWSWKINEIMTDERYNGCKGDLQVPENKVILVDKNFATVKIQVHVLAFSFQLKRQPYSGKKDCSNYHWSDVSDFCKL